MRRSKVLLIVLLFILCESVSSEIDSLDHKDTISVMIDKTIEVKGKVDYIRKGYIPNITLLYVLVLNNKDSTELAGINLTLSDGGRGITNDSGMCLFYPDKAKNTSIKLSQDGYKYTAELDYSKRIDTFYIPYPMLIEDTVFSFSGYALYKKDSLPVSGASIRFYGLGVRQTTTNSEGYFIFENLFSGDYTLTWAFKTSRLQMPQGYFDNITIESTNIIDTFYLDIK